MTSDPLLTPFRLRHLTLRNRVISTAHEPAYGENGMPTERYRLYHVEKARGGVALTMTAGSAIVSRDSPAAFGNLQAWRDEIVPWLARLAGAVHDEGAAVMIQLTHLGRRTGWNRGDWLPVLAPSPVREPAHRAFPKEAEDWDIARIVGDYAEAAARMQAAGLDGIELEAYGHLIDQFWSPATNRRQDAWGGSLDNRLRFTFAVLAAVRAAVGPGFIVGLRMVADEDWDRGLSREEGVEIARRLAASGQVDFLNIIRGHIDTDAALSRVIPIQGMASAPHLDFAGEVRAALRIPVFHAARIADVATARHAIASGKLDMVGMTRAQIADPHLVRKLMAGQEARIRPCVGATYCLDRIYEGGEALCIHNAATGREATLPHDIPRAAVARHVVVVGAGPAGLEAARVAGERGHRVTLIEAGPRAGGQVALLVANPRRREMWGIIDWRLAEIDRLGVAQRYNLAAEADDITALAPDVVVIATGGVPQLPEVAGAELAVTPWDVLSGAARLSGEVLVYDDNGAHSGLSAAEVLARAGARVEIASPERMFAPEVGGLNLVPYLRAFHETGVRITPAVRVTALTRAGNRIAVTLGSDYTAAPVGTRLVDHVVMDHATRPADEIYHALKPISSNRGEVDYRRLVGGGPVFPRRGEGDFLLYRIGDAVAARNIHAAIHDALRLGLRV
jgi:2,4-dienoyl-CoA reductase-like NADH-dependent reductase (Old Yellow Enzyme family)